MGPDFMRGKIAIIVGHAQQPFADTCILLALGLVGQLGCAFEKRFRIDHDELQIRFRLTDNHHSQTQFLPWFDDKRENGTASGSDIN
jgi:hypothetical protein